MAAGARISVTDVAPGLWLWRLPYPDWKPGVGWEEHVSSTCVESGGEVALLDPLAPPEDDAEVWARLDARPPTLVVVLKPDHVRDVDVFVRRYGCRAYGPWLFWRTNIPETELEPIEPGSELPGGLVALYDGRGRNETPLWLPEQRTLVFADALTAPAGELRVWATPALEARALPALRAMLQLPFERVIRLTRRAGARPGGVQARPARWAAVDRRALARDPRPSDQDPPSMAVFRSPRAAAPARYAHVCNRSLYRVGRGSPGPERGQNGLSSRLYDRRNREADIRFMLLTYNAPGGKEIWAAMSEAERAAEEAEYHDLIQSMREERIFLAAEEVEHYDAARTVRMRDGIRACPTVLR